MSYSEILLYKLRVIGDKTESIHKNVKYECCPEKHKHSTKENVIKIEDTIIESDNQLKSDVLHISNSLKEANKELSDVMHKLDLLEKTKKV